LRDCEIRITDHGIVDGTSLCFFNVLFPQLVAFDRIDAQSDYFSVALRKFGGKLCHVPEFSRANRGEIFWMGEQYAPSISEPFMKIDITLGGLCHEVGGYIVDA